MPALAHEALQRDIIEHVADRAVTDAVVARRVIDSMGGRQLRLRGLHAGKIEVALHLRCDEAIDIHLRLGRHRIERTACGCDSGIVQRPRILDERILDVLDDLRDLRHIVDLAIEHGTRLMLLPLRRHDMQQAIGLFLRNDTDDAARADIERKEAVFVLAHRLRFCLFRGLGRGLARGCLFARGCPFRLARTPRAALRLRRCCAIGVIGFSGFRHKKLLTFRNFHNN